MGKGVEVETTQIYLEATLAMKAQALAKTIPHRGRPGRYRPADQLLGFLNSLECRRNYVERLAGSISAAAAISGSA
jgi:hypothetical protein